MDNGNQYRNAFSKLKDELTRLLSNDERITVIKEGIYLSETHGYIQVISNVSTYDGNTLDMVYIIYVPVYPGVTANRKETMTMSVLDFTNRNYKFQFDLNSLVIKT